MKNLNIRAKLFILVFVILIPMIILHSFDIVSRYRQSIDSEFRSSQDFAQAISSTFTNYIERLWDTELAIGTAIVSNPSLKAEDIQAYMKGIVSLQPTVLRYTLISPEGVVIASTADHHEGILLSDRDYYKRIIMGESKVVSPIIEGRLSEHIIMPVARGIWKDGKLMGIVSAAVDVNMIGSVLPDYRLGETSSFGIIDSNGRIVYRKRCPDIPYSKRLVPPEFPAWGALKGQIVKTFNREALVGDDNRMSIDYPISNLGWECFSSITVNEVLDKTTREITTDIIVLLIVIGLSFLLAILLGRQFIRSVTCLEEASISISKGNLNVRTNIKGNDEISSAGRAFDRMVERIQRLEASRSLFLQTAAHELRNPMTGIKSIASLIRRRINNGKPINETLGMLEVLEKEVDRLARLLNQIIEAFKAQNGSLPIKADYEPVDIVQVIDSALRPHIAAEDHIYNFKADTDSPILVLGNSERLEDAIRNLLGNAAKYSPPGSMVDVGLKLSDSHVVISIRDEGIGIPKEQIDHIFDSFYRGNNFKGNDPGGMGLGLYICRDNILKHSGTIWAENNEDKGSTFYIKLPLYTKQEGVECDGTCNDY